MMLLSLRKAILVAILFQLSFSSPVSTDSLRKVASSSLQFGAASTINSTGDVPSIPPLSTTIPHGPTVTSLTNSTAISGKNDTRNYSTAISDKNDTIRNNSTDINGKNDTTGNDTLPYIDPSTPPVTITITTPAPARNLLFKIGANITFAWKYSANFSIKPKYINVLAQPSVNSEQYFTIIANASGTITSAIWNTAEETSLPVTKYKLYIFDERGKDASISPGRLWPFSGLFFSLYQPQDRTDIS
ncbi:9903_t:CDS:2, partial [Cetraspora pellucida]